jgi:formate/nitrite transporter FocA (FNT family)
MARELCAFPIFASRCKLDDAEYFLDFAWPVLLGNCIGGVTLVAVVNYAQATAGSEDRGASAQGQND